MGNSKRTGIGIGVAIAAGIAAFLIVGFATGSPLFKTPKEQTVSIITGTISVGPAQYTSYTISIPGGVSNAKVSGTFTTGGGVGNGIKVEILDLQNFLNLKNGQQVNAIYSTNQENTGNIDVSVPTNQTLYLIYDNTFSANSTKQVATDVSVTYASK